MCLRKPGLHTGSTGQIRIIVNVIWKCLIQLYIPGMNTVSCLCCWLIVKQYSYNSQLTDFTHCALHLIRGNDINKTDQHMFKATYKHYLFTWFEKQVMTAYHRSPQWHKSKHFCGVCVERVFCKPCLFVLMTTKIYHLTCWQEESNLGHTSERSGFWPVN